MMTGTRNANETDLPDAEPSLEVLLDNVPDLIFFKDLDSRFTRVNAAFASYVGLTDPRDALGKSDADYFPPADAQAYFAEEHVVLTTGDALIGKLESRVGPDGETRWVLTNKVPIRDGDGRITGLVGIARDITKRKAAEDALRQAEARFESLLRNALDIVTILDAEGPVRYVSPAVERVLGYQPDELIGRNVIDLVHPEDQSGLEAAFSTAVDDPMCVPTVKFRFLHKNGTWRWLKTTMTNLLADPCVRGIVVNSRDISEPKAVEEALRQSESGLAEAQRLAHLGSWEWDILSNYVTWSEELYRIVGTTRDEFAPSFEGYLAHVHPEDRLRVQGIIVQALANRQDFEYEHRMMGTDGVVNIIHAKGRVILDPEGRAVGFRGTDQDIRARKRLEENLQYQAFHDSLTDLPNRTCFIARLEEALLMASQGHQTVAVLFLDLDRFKVINDSLGHMSGDQALCAVAARLYALLRDADTLARFGGDEFAVLLTGKMAADEVERVAYRILDAFDVPFVVGGSELFITVSVGIALKSSALTGAMDLLQAADVAMYHAKATGPGGYGVFDPDMNLWAVERLELETDLQRAMEHKELVLHYQPKVDLATGAIVAVEALLRWQHPRLGPLQPGDFLQLAEETGLIVRIGRWVLEEACRQAVAWRATSVGFGDCLMCVNLSAREFRQPDLVTQVARILEEIGLPPGALELEITEQVLLDDNQALASLVHLRKLGVHLALDDFGTGHSALSSLRRLPIEMLKIDRSFVQDMVMDRKTRAVVQAVTVLAHELGMTVVAEGVETEIQLESVRNLGIDIVQGAYFARASSASDCLALLATWSARKDS